MLRLATRAPAAVKARGIFVAEVVSHAFVIKFDLELVATQRVGAAGDLIHKLAGADIAVVDGDGALQVVVGEDDG